MINVFIWWYIKLYLNNWESICMKELYKLPTAWLIYVHEHVILSRPSVGSIRVYEPYSLSFFPMGFGPSDHSATVSRPPYLPYCEKNDLCVLVCNIPSTFFVLEPLLALWFYPGNSLMRAVTFSLRLGLCVVFGFVPPWPTCWNSLKEFLLMFRLCLS